MDSTKSFIDDEERWDAPYEPAELKQHKQDIKAVTVQWQRWTAALVVVSAIASPLLVVLLG